MIRHICDHCGKEIDPYNRFLVTYTGGKEAELCKVCFEKFFCWLKGKPTENSMIENYEKAIYNYQQQIIDLKEELDKTKISRDWWKNRCNGNLS